jgi:hypothetical protein
MYLAVLNARIKSSYVIFIACKSAPKTGNPGPISVTSLQMSAKIGSVTRMELPEIEKTIEYSPVSAFFKIRECPAFK